MFRLSCALALMGILPLAVHAEVVLQNTTTGTGTTGSSAGDFAITFTAPADATLAGITLYNSNNSLSTFSSFNWTLMRGSTSVGSKSFTSASLDSGNTINGNGGSTRYGYYFDFSGSALTDPLLATSYTLSTVGLNNSVSGWSFATGSSISATGGSGFSNASYAVSGDPLYNFQLSTAAVPEPGTLALGALAAIAGAVAWWWRQVWFPLG